MPGITVYQFSGKKFAVWRDRFREEFPAADPAAGNPLLWFAKDLEFDDLVVGGVKTKREALDFIGAPPEQR